MFEQKGQKQNKHIKLADKDFVKNNKQKTH